MLLLLFYCTSGSLRNPNEEELRDSVPETLPLHTNTAAAMAPRRIADRPDRKRDLKSWVKREYRDPAKYQANLVRHARTLLPFPGNAHS